MDDFFRAANNEGINRIDSSDYDFSGNGSNTAHWHTETPKKRDVTAILLLGHGSRAVDANEAMHHVASDLRATGQYSIVECAFLEINQPDIPAGLTNCREAGATHIVVIPYFLHLGNHVKKDLPEIIGNWQQTNPTIDVTVGQHFGYSPKLVELVQERIGQAVHSYS